MTQNVALLATIPGRPAWPGVSPSSAAAKAVAGSATLMLKTLMVMAVVVGLATTASAQTVACTANNNANEINFNGPLIFGQVFSVSGAGIEVSQLGFYDYNNQPLTYSHAVTLFNNETPIATVTIQAGSATNFVSGFAYAALSTPIYLPAGQYTVLAYGMCNGGADLEGDDGGKISFNDDANMSVERSVYNFTSQGSPDYPGGPGDVGGYGLNWDEPTASASFIYTDATGGSSTWSGGGTDTNWSTVANWNTPPGSIGALTFAGSTGLTNNNDLSGFAASSITFDAAAGAFTLNGNAIQLGGIGFNGNPVAPVTQTVNLNVALSTDITIDSPANGNLAFNGAITSVGGLTTIDAGTVTLGGTNTLESMDVDGGTNIITGNTTLNGDNEFGYDRFYVGDGDAYNGCLGTLIIQPGAVLDVIGNFNDNFVIGRDPASGGRVIQNGGRFTFNPSNGHQMVLGATGNPNLQSEYDMNGGLLDMSGGQLSVGWAYQAGSSGFMNQSGGVITNVNGICIPNANGGYSGNTGLGVYTLSGGGSVYLLGGGIFNQGPNYVINLGHGTVGAEATWYSTLNMNLTNLGGGSVTFDTGAGYTIALSGALSGNGGLTVAGTGTLDLSGANSYTGDTVVNAGSTLEWGVTGSDPTTLRLANGAVLRLDDAGPYTVLGCYTNGVALANGTYNASNLSPFITGAGNLVVAAAVSATADQTVAYTANVNINPNNFSLINVGHLFNVSGAGIEVFQLGYFDYQNHALAGQHAVTLFSGETEIATVTIPAGPATNLIGGFDFVPLSTPIYLPAGQYTVLAYGDNVADTSGEQGGYTSFNGSANLASAGGCYDWSSQGSPDYPGGPGDIDNNGLGNSGYSVGGWDDATATASFTYANGIEVTTPPVVNQPVVSGGNLILTGSVGIADAPYTMLTTTSLTAPVIWTTYATGTLDGSGNFSQSIPISPSTPSQFFKLQMQ